MFAVVTLHAVDYNGQPVIGRATIAYPTSSIVLPFNSHEKKVLSDIATKSIDALPATNNVAPKDIETALIGALLKELISLNVRTVFIPDFIEKGLALWLHKKIREVTISWLYTDKR